jgi:hypothetical protein
MKRLFLFIVFIITILGCSKMEKSSSWNDPVIPVSLVGIETVNIDNSGELPLISDFPVKKEAYMVGIKWITEHTPSEDDDKFITGPIWEGEHLYRNLSNKYSKAIKCLTQFNATIPAGKYISKFFKEIDRNYLPEDIDEGYVLLVVPDTGMHSFRVEYYERDSLKFFHDTPPIRFY